MKFHVIALPHTQTTTHYLACAYTMKTINFCRMMMERGHAVVLYAGEENEAPCTEHVACIDEASRARAVGQGHFTAAPFGAQFPHWQQFNASAIREAKKRAAPGDFLCLIGGHAQKPVADALPQMTAVEFGVGYSGTFANFRVFESYAWMHMHYGAAAQRANGDVAGVGGDGHFYDVVIPGYLDPEQFPFRADKDDYFLFVGRLIDRKGYAIAQDVCQRLGKRLVIAGQGEQRGYGEFVGVVGPEERGRLMAGAKALFAPTLYVEPFGNVAVEAQACGTPVIATDWGAFTETVVDGVTGFRCRTLGEFMGAAQRVDELDPQAIRDRAVRLYGLDTIGALYERYFNRLTSLNGEGWYSETDWRTAA